MIGTLFAECYQKLEWKQITKTNGKNFFISFDLRKWFNPQTSNIKRL